MIDFTNFDLDAIERALDVLGHHPNAAAAITYLRGDRDNAVAEVHAAGAERAIWEEIAERHGGDFGAVIMRERAAKACENIEEILRQGYAITSANAVGEAYCAIRALPLPTHADLLAAALELPEIKALVDEVRRFNARVISGEVRSTKTFNTFRHALAALEPK